MAARALHLLSQRAGWTGSGVALDAMVRAADRRGWEQCVALGTSPEEPSPRVGGLAPERIRPLVFESDLLPFRLPGMSDVMPYPSSRFSRMTNEQLTAYRQAWREHVGRAIDECRPDVIHSHHLWLLSSLIKDLTGNVPVVTHCHGTGLRQMELCPHLRESVQAGCARNEAFVVLHRGHGETLQELLGVRPDQVHIVGSGFRSDVFHDRGRRPTPGPVVTYAGKLSHAKGLPWLIDAVERVAQRTKGVVLNVAGSGSGSEADALRQRIAHSPHVVYRGQLDQESLAKLFRRSAVFALPSFFEGLPLVLVEAAACSCRLVATALPGVVDELQPRLGESLEIVSLPRLESTDRPVADDLPAFVARLAGALETALAKPLLQDSARFVADLTWDAVFERIETVWRAVADDSRG